MPPKRKNDEVSKLSLNTENYQILGIQVIVNLLRLRCYFLFAGKFWGRGHSIAKNKLLLRLEKNDIEN